MLFSILLFSFLAGVLTVLAPCVLPLLPVILSGSLAGQNKWRPYVIIGSLIFSLLIFTLLLKVSTVFIHVDPVFWEYVSGGILVLFSLTLIFPKLWPWLMDITGIERWSQKSLENANKKGGIWGAVFLGAALGPIFSSCNPTYTLLLATILPADRVTGMLGLLSYFVGLGLILFLVAHFGRNIISRFKFFSNPNGLFRKTLGIIIFLVGGLIVTGCMKDIETYIVERGFFINTYSLDERINQGLLPPEPMMCSGGVCKPKNAKNGSAMMNIGDAPELAGIADWINSQPLTLASLRGKVVLVDFWTYSCINCKRTQPYLNTWYDMYEKDGLVIIGVHAPEFTFEKITSNVREASKKAGIRYPVALDNNFTTWNAYANQYWPAKYLIDQEGRIRYKHFGEGKYDETEKAIQELLGLSKSDERVQKIAKSYDPATFLQSNMLPEKQNTLTPETYLGTMRAKNMVFETGLFQDGPQAFSAAELQLVNNWTLSGPWKVTGEYLESLGENSALILRFAAKKVFLVVSSDMKKGEIIVNVLNNKKEVVSTKTISVADDELYTVFESEKFENDVTITLQPSDGLRLHAFTFGD